MIQWLLPVFLFVVELGVVYGVATAVSAFGDVSVSDVVAEESAPPQEARIVVVSSPVAADDVEETAEAAPEKKERVRPKRRPAEPAIVQSESVVATEATELPIDQVYTVPFYSQFADISAASWQKVGCGIASLAMLIDYYADEIETVDALLSRGIAARAFLDDAGWIHSGLIRLAQPYGLGGESVSWQTLSADGAFAKLEDELTRGPVMASVHYTFEPTNPIPHLVVVTGVQDGQVFYNDPAEVGGGNSLSIEKFQRAWKQRYIVIRPV